MTTTSQEYSVDGRRVRALRLRKKHWTQEELARATGLQTGTISRIETGYHHPQLATLLKIAAALEVDLDDLVMWNVEI